MSRIDEIKARNGFYAQLPANHVYCTDMGYLLDQITQRDAQIQRLRTAHQNGGGALLDAAFAALERWMEEQ